MEVEMSINIIQFQKGLSLSDFIQRYGTENQCGQALFKARWPNGFCCPECEANVYNVFHRDGHTY
jgi:hypothetical protein